MKEIPLTQGQVALVDDGDYAWLSQWNWRAARHRSCFYAVRSVWNTKTQRDEHVYMHRVILGATPQQQVDHVNHRGLDNSRSNLRLCSNAENQSGQRKQARHTSSHFKGVHWDKSGRKWCAAIKCNGIKYNLGSFDDESCAARAYDRKARELFGGFAYLNF